MYFGISIVDNTVGISSFSKSHYITIDLSTDLVIQSKLQMTLYSNLSDSVHKGEKKKKWYRLKNYNITEINLYNMYKCD